VILPLYALRFQLAVIYNFLFALSLYSPALTIFRLPGGRLLMSKDAVARMMMYGSVPEKPWILEKPFFVFPLSWPVIFFVQCFFFLVSRDVHTPCPLLTMNKTSEHTGSAVISYQLHARGIMLVSCSLTNIVFFSFCLSPSRFVLFLFFFPRICST
jgi:hypothetical protein